MKLFCYIKRFWEIPVVEKQLLLLTIFVNLSIKFIVKAIPLRYYYFILKLKPIRLIEDNDKVDSYLHIINKTIKRLLKNKIISNNCLEKSLTLRIILNTVGIPNQLKISLTTSQNMQLLAHCYIKISDKRSFFKDLRFNDILFF